MDLTKAPQLDLNSIYRLVTAGDTSKLDAQQKVAYYLARCEQAGLDPETVPFEFLKLGGREILYARKGATDQLARNNGIRVSILSQETIEGVRIVTVQALCPDGRATEEIGAVPIGNLKGEAASNAYMKAVTKAKRRAILSVTGLGILDELEAEGAQRAGKGALPPMPTAEEQAELDKSLPAPPVEEQPAQVEGTTGTLNENQIALLMATCRNHKVTAAKLKKFLAAHGWKSRKEIPSDRLEEVLTWVRDQE